MKDAHFNNMWILLYIVVCISPQEFKGASNTFHHQGVERLDNLIKDKSLQFQVLLLRAIYSKGLGQTAESTFLSQCCLLEQILSRKWD